MADSDSMSTTDPIDQRIVFALRQCAFVAVALLIVGLVAARLRPAEALERGIVSTPFLWAIVVWTIVLFVNALAFDQSRMRELEQGPLYVSLILGAAVFAIGLVGFDQGDASRRMAYLLANSLGAVMFWWGLLSLGYLIASRLRT